MVGPIAVLAAAVGTRLLLGGTRLPAWPAGIGRTLRSSRCVVALGVVVAVSLVAGGVAVSAVASGAAARWSVVPREGRA